MVELTWEGKYDADGKRTVSIFARYGATDFRPRWATRRDSAREIRTLSWTRRELETWLWEPD